MHIKELSVLNRWNPQEETLRFDSHLETVKSKRWERGSLERVVSNIASLIKSNNPNIFRGVVPEKLSALGNAIHKKDLSSLDKKVLVQILKQLYSPHLTVSLYEDILETGANFGIIEHYFETAYHYPSLFKDPKPFLQIMNRVSIEKFKKLATLASNVSETSFRSRAIYLLANTPDKHHSKLIKLINEFIDGGCPELSLKWEAEDWLKISSDWLSYIARMTISNKEKCVQTFLKDPTSIKTATQLKSLFPTLKCKLLTAVSAVQEDKREAMILACHLLCIDADMTQRLSILDSFHTYEEILNKIQAIPKEEKDNHISKIEKLAPFLPEHLLGLLSIPIDQFDRLIKCSPTNSLETIIAIGRLSHLSDSEIEEVSNLALKFSKLDRALPLFSCLNLIVETPKDQWERLWTIYSNLGTKRPFISHLSAIEVLKINDSWIPYLENGMIDLFLKDPTLFSFVKKLPITLLCLDSVKLLNSCQPDSKRAALVETINLMYELGEEELLLNFLRETDIPYEILPAYIRTLQEKITNNTLIRLILEGFIMEEPDYLKLILAFIEGLHLTGSIYFCRNLRSYSFATYRLALSLVNQQMQARERSDLLECLARCKKENREKVVELVKMIGVKTNILEIIKSIGDLPNNCTAAVNLIKKIEASDNIKATILKILLRCFKEAQFKSVIPHLLNLLSEGEDLDYISNDFNIRLEALRDYSKLLNKISYAPLKQAIFSVILNEDNYEELFSILLVLTEGINNTDEVEVIRRLRYKIDIIKFVHTHINGPKQNYLKVINSLSLINSPQKRSRLFSYLAPNLINQSLEAKLELFSLINHETHQYIDSIIKHTYDLENKFLALNIFLDSVNIVTQRGITSYDAVFLIKTNFDKLKEKSKESRHLLLIQKSYSYQVLLNHYFDGWSSSHSIIDNWFSKTTTNFEALQKAFNCRKNNNWSSNLKEEFLSDRTDETDGAIRALRIEKMSYCFDLLSSPAFPKNFEKNVRSWFKSTNCNYKDLSDAIFFTLNSLHPSYYGNIFKDNLPNMRDGKEKAIYLTQQTTLILLKQKFPFHEKILPKITNTTTSNIECLLKLDSIDIICISLSLLALLKDGKEKLHIYRAIELIDPKDRLDIIKYAMERANESSNHKQLIQQGFYYHKILKELNVSEKVKLNLQKLLESTYFEYETVYEQIQSYPINQRPFFIEVLLAECLASRSLNFEIRSNLIEHFFNDLPTYLPLIMDRPKLIHYLICHHYFDMQEAIGNKTYPPHIQSLLIPFLKPSQIVTLIYDEDILKKPITSGERSWLTPAEPFEQLQRSSDLNLILSELGEEGFIQAIPFTALALLAKTRPTLILPYLPYFGDLQLAATLPFLDPKSVVQKSMVLQKAIMFTKRAPLELKRLLVETTTPPKSLIDIQLMETFYKVCQEGDPFPIPSHKQEELEAAKKAAQVQFSSLFDFDIPPRYQDCTTLEVMSDPIELPQKGKYVDRSTLNQLKKSEDQIRNPIDNLYYPSKAFREDLKLKKELMCIDKHTGKVLEKPLKVPPDYRLHIDTSLLNQLEKNGNEVKSPFDLKYYPIDSFLPDPELEAWLSDSSSETGN